MTARTWTGSRVTADRAWWAARIIQNANAGTPLLCPFCGLEVKLDRPWDVEHLDKRADGGHLGRSNQTPAHRLKADCPGGGNLSDGASYGNRRRSRRARRLRG